MKALLLNGSPNKQGSTYTALGFIKEALEEEGVAAEIFHVPPEPIAGCVACHKCKAGGARCAFDGDAVNLILEKMEQADALVVGSPTYFASPNGHLIAVLDRVFFAGTASATIFNGKPAAAITAARRGGATAALEVMQKYFTIAGMPIAPSSYWPMIHGRAAADVVQDAEGVQSMKMTGKTIAWLLKCIEAGKAEGLSYPRYPDGEKVWTDFIR